MWLPLLAAMLLTAPLFTGCNTQGCTDNRSALLLTGFYAIETRKAITIDSLEIGGFDAPNDSLLVTAKEKISQFYIPLRSQYTSTTFNIHYAQKALNNPNLDDQITFEYTTEPYFAGEECGAMYRYHIHKLQYTKHIIDSIALPDSLIDNANVERMKIFFRTQAQ